MARERKTGHVEKQKKRIYIKKIKISPNPQTQLEKKKSFLTAEIMRLLELQIKAP